MCDALSNPPNGIVTVDKMAFIGSVAVYECNFGFILEGDRQRQCQRGDSPGWTGTEPSCQGTDHDASEVVNCRPLSIIDNDVIIDDDVIINDDVIDL